MNSNVEQVILHTDERTADQIVGYDSETTPFQYDNQERSITRDNSKSRGARQFESQPA